MHFLFVSTIAPRPRAPTQGIFVHEMAKALIHLGHSVDILVPVRIFPPEQLLRAFLRRRNSSPMFRTFKEWTDTWMGAQGTYSRDFVRYIFKRFTSSPTVSRSGSDCEQFSRSHASWLEKEFQKQHYSFVLGHFLHSAPLVQCLSSRDCTRSSVYIHEDVRDYHTTSQRAQAVINVEKCEALLTNSQASRERLVAAFSKVPRVGVVHLGIAEAFIESKSNSLPSSVPRRLQLVNVSRYTRRKNHELLVRVIARWNSSGRPITLQLRLVGDYGPARPAVEQLAKDLGVADLVEFSDALGPESIVAALSGGHIFVFPSRFESFGIVLLEAASQGLIVVSGSEVGAAKELESLGFGVRYVDVDSDDSVISALDDICNRFTEYRFEADRLRRFVTSQFTWEHTAEAILEYVSA